MMSLSSSSSPLSSLLPNGRRLDVLGRSVVVEERRFGFVESAGRGDDDETGG